jgi:hypothetical protein
MARYAFVLHLADESAALGDDALVTAICRLGPLGRRNGNRAIWVGEAEASDKADALRTVEAKLAALPRYVPSLRLVTVSRLA